jgi:hypothetical protein
MPWLQIFAQVAFLPRDPPEQLKGFETMGAYVLKKALLPEKKKRSVFLGKKKQALLG